MKISKRLMFQMLVAASIAASPLYAQNESPFKVMSEVTSVQKPILREPSGASNADFPAFPVLHKNLDTVFAVIRRNKVAMSETGSLDMRSATISSGEESKLKKLMLKYSSKYTEPDLDAKNAMCRYFNSPDNESQALSIRAANAFEFLESQSVMEARWQSIGVEFLQEVRDVLGGDVFQAIQTERDGIYAVGSSTGPVSSKEFVLSRGLDITETVVGNCTGGAK